MGTTITPTPVRTTDDDDELLVHESSPSLHSNNDTNNANSNSNKKTISNIPALVCAFSAAATTGGTSYAFGLYSAALKHNLHLTQSELDSISTAFFVAGLFSWIPGLCSDKYGTKFAMSLGGIIGSIALLLYWSVSRQFIVIATHSTLVFILSTLGIIIFLSCALVTGAVFKILVAATGPGTKGSAVGAAKGYVGLGAGLYACMFEAFRKPGETELDFLPMAAFFFITCATIPALLCLPSKHDMEKYIYEDESTSKHFNRLYMSLATMALLIVANSMFNLYETSETRKKTTLLVVDDSEIIGSSNASSASSSSHYGIALILVFIWLMPIYSLRWIPRQIRSTDNYGDGVMILPDDDDDDDELNDEVTNDDNDVEFDRDGSIRRRRSNNEKDVLAQPTNKQSVKRKTSRDDEEEQRGLLLPNNNNNNNRQHDDDEENSESLVLEDSNSPVVVVVVNDEINLNLIQMLSTPSAWLMLWTTTILVGAGTVETNNMGQMVEALGFPQAVTSASLALFSVAQAAGRIFTGAISESALNWNTHRFGIDNGIPRPFFLVLASILGFISHFLLGLAKTEIVFVFGATLAGAAFGMVWPLMVLITGEVFGTANVGANYMFFDGFTSAAGTLLLTKVIAQEVYETHISPDAADKTMCIGMSCFQETHMAVAALSLTCILTSLAMLQTTRHTYNRCSLHAA